MHPFGSHADGTLFRTSLVIEFIFTATQLSAAKQESKKPLLPGQAEGVITSMDTAKQQASEHAQLQAQ